MLKLDLNNGQIQEEIKQILNTFLNNLKEFIKLEKTNMGIKSKYLWLKEMIY